MLSAFLLLQLVILVSSQSINWQGDWAMNCDFYGNDLSNAYSRGEDCGGLCASTPGCTHFTWMYYQCYMKKGSVSKNDAKYKDGCVCGVMGGGNGGGGGDGGSGGGGDGGNGGGDGGAVIGDGSGLSKDKWPFCKFKAGRSYGEPDTDYSKFDYVSIWIDTISPEFGTDFNPYYQGPMIDACNKYNIIPVFYAYIIAFEARLKHGFKDCNVDYNHNLCVRGAQYIRDNRAFLVSRYEHQAKSIAERLGKDKTCIFLIEADFWQYYGDHQQQGGTLSGEYMRDLFNDFVSAIKAELPNALISWDISPWIGEDGFRRYWSFFKNSQIDFISTSGGHARGDNDRIYFNELPWNFVSRETGKKIIADCGYGVEGSPDDNCGPWNNPYNQNNRIRDGVIAVTQAHTFFTLPRPNVC